MEQSYQELPNVLLGLVEVAWSLWLYTNSRTRPVWKFTFILFMAFFVYGAYTAYLRKPCDCFGDLAVTARWVLLLDAVALASIVSILKLARLSRDLERSIAGPVSFGIFTVFSAIAGNAILYNFSSLSQPVQLAKETVSVTGISPETRIFVAEVRIKNASRNSLQVTGLSPHCGVKYSANIPLDIASGEIASIAISSKLREDSLTGTVPLSIYTSEGGTFQESRLDITVDASKYASILIN